MYLSLSSINNNQDDCNCFIVHYFQDFFDLMRLYFPIVYDIKYLMKSCKTLKGGLQVNCVIQVDKVIGSLFTDLS